MLFVDIKCKDFTKKLIKILYLEILRHFKKRKKGQNSLTFVEDFFLPFGGKLNKDNRWAFFKLIPWWNAVS